MKHVEPEMVRTIQTEVLDRVKEVQFYRFPRTTKTVCCLTMEDGYSTTGESSCDVGGFDAERGRQLALQRAIGNAWSRDAYRPVVEGSALDRLMAQAAERARGTA